LSGSSLPYDPTKARRTLFRALTDAGALFGSARTIVIDGDGRAFTYGELQLAALALGHALKKGTRKGEAVGVLLPTGIGAVIATFALSAYGRVPAMLNFTAGEQSLQAALSAANIRRILTPHRFIEVGRYQNLEAELRSCAELVYLDELREKLSFWDKANAAVGSKLPGAIVARTSPDSPAVILFTSGTEGEPKGVVLSHANILANVEQVRAHIPLTTRDVVFNPLPMFHSFGLTVGALMPIFLGIKAVLHPTPRQPREIVQRIRENAATILLATDTFISQYMRTAGDGDLSSLRLAVCGAERLHDETRQLARRKYDFELLEGYGVTEGAPVLSANQPGANRAGTVGHLLTCIEHRVEPVQGIAEGGRLFVKGPNIMLGYLSPGQPGGIMVPPGGWHDTGDVVSIDSDGYVAIRGRLKRFAKIGGEQVSLTVVENCASALWPDHVHAAIAVPDGRKGETVVLVTTNPDAGRDELLVWARNHGVPELAVPRRVVPVADVPVLGTGKTDYVAVAKMVASIADKSASSVHE
jgi:acyl-[acyl-carrier-protein]-phospholipid O-acyltransferase/long-chain-fatty-acid--[acyl-carrier-protein] ligase